MRYVILGDVHGCYEETTTLLELMLDLEEDDVIIPIGDLFHKGPSEGKVINYFMSRCDQYVLGNHEEKQIRWEKHEIKRAETGKPNPMKHVENYEFPTEKQRDWIRNAARLFIPVYAGKKKFLLVHGGIEPSMKFLPQTNLPWEIPKKKRQHSFTVLRTRYVNPQGRMVSMGEETDEDVFWAEVYDGRFGHVIFGHQPYLDRASPKEYPHATGIDLGCVYGNYLCALIIDGETGETSHMVIKAFEKYVDPLRELE